MSVQSNKVFKIIFKVLIVPPFFNGLMVINLIPIVAGGGLSACLVFISNGHKCLINLETSF